MRTGSPILIGATAVLGCALGFTALSAEPETPKDTASIGKSTDAKPGPDTKVPLAAPKSDRFIHTRNYFVPDPPPPKPPEPVPVKKEEPKVVVPPTIDDPADSVVLTGIARMPDGNWMAVTENLKTRRGEFVAIGSDVPDAPGWRLERLDGTAERAYFQFKGRTVEAVLGSNLTGKNTDKVNAILGAGRVASAGASATAPGGPYAVGSSGPGGSGGSSFAPRTGPTDRVNRKSGISEADAKLLEGFLERSEAELKKPPGESTKKEIKAELKEDKKKKKQDGESKDGDGSNGKEDDE